MGTARWHQILLWSLAAAVPLAFLAVFFALPVTALALRGFAPDGAVDLSGFAEVFSRDRTWRILRLTLLLGAAGTLCSVLLGVPGAYVFYRRTFRGQRVLRAFITVPFVLPTVVVGVAFRAVLASDGPLGFLGLDRTVPAVVLALVFFNYAVVVRTVGGMGERVGPRTEQAARALGAAPARAFWSVTLPALTPALASAAAVVFLFCSTAFGVVLVLGGIEYGTIETEIWVQTTQFLDLRPAAVLSVLQLAVVTVALAVFSRARSRREAALRLQGLTHQPRPLRLWHRPTRLAAASPRRPGHWESAPGRWGRPGPDLPATLVTAAVIFGDRKSTRLNS